MTVGALGASQGFFMRGLVTRAMWLVLGIIGVLGLIGYSIFNQIAKRSIPVDYANDIEHFKYGSIGSDTPEGTGIPYWIWRAMPDVCPDLLPGGYASLGVVLETGMDRPIGFSKRRTGFFDSVGLNCASCHTATVRESPDGERQYFLAASSHQLNLWDYFNFQLSCGQDPRFSTDNVMAAIDKLTELGFLERFIYQVAVGRVRDAMADRAKKVSWIKERPLWGPGRVDTFNPYKTLVLGWDMSGDPSIGTADFMVVWNQKLREGLWVHWDGNNNSVAERNLSAAIGAGATPATVDLERLARIRDWIWQIKAPPYPFAIDQPLAANGKPIYQQYCASCHEPGGAEFGKAVPVEQVGTDPERARAFDAKMAEGMNTIGKGYPWQFHNFRTTGGYTNDALDGAWLRAPYLHNGSVPTLADLLTPPTGRPAKFFKGYDIYDKTKLGFVSDVAKTKAQKFFEFDTAEKGNSNAGHDYGTDLSPADKAALIEYMKTL
jgi:mono/diheme cytochrome c family protein